MRGEVDRYGDIGEALDLLGYKWTRINCGRRGGVWLAKKGWPDFIACAPSGATFVPIEAKREDGELRESQREFRDWCVAHRVPYYVVNDGSDVIARLRHDCRVSS